MLTKFAVKNYRGFADWIEWDLQNTSNYEFNKFAIKQNVIKNGIVYGPNGVGKTNFSLAIFDIVNHLSVKFKKSNYYENFASISALDSLIEFDYVFKFDNHNIEYKYSKNANGILIKEDFYLNSHQVFYKDKTKLTIDQNLIPINKESLKTMIGHDNNVSLINFLLLSFPFPKNHYFVQLQNFVNSMLWFRCLENREFIGLETDIYILDEFIIKNKLVKDFSEFLLKVSNQKFDFEEPKVGEKLLKCRIYSKSVIFNQITSTGTRALQLLYFWIKKMDKASFVFIDEFDAFYHYKLSYEVCKLLFKLNCQVFMSSHNTYLMTNELLRPDCNFVINNNKIKPLCECTDKELRFGHNIEKMFRGGTFNL